MRKKSSKLQSRKFWMAVISAIIIIVNALLGKPIDANELGRLIIVIISYILAEAGIDITNSITNSKKKE